MTEATTQAAVPTTWPLPGDLRRVDVFVAGPGGGNPVPFIADAEGLSAQQMQAVAQSTGHESAFVLPPVDPEAGWRFRFFVPQHEMEMCGHATVGTLWALRQWGRWREPTARIETLSGPVDARWDAAQDRVWISQPAVRTGTLSHEDRRRVAAVLGLPANLPPPPMANATTSRTKTLVQLPDAGALHALQPDFAAMEALCTAINSTGLYPYALVDVEAPGGPVVAARQFPKASGYPEDAATGIAAAALWGHLAATGAIATGTAEAPLTCTVRQGEAMGRPSAIVLRARFDAGGMPAGCWLSGEVAWAV